MAKRRSHPVARRLTCVVLGTLLLWGTVEAREFLRGSSATPSAPAAASVPGTAASTAPVIASGHDRLEQTNQALNLVKQMQTAARNLAIAGPNNLKPNLPAVPENSYLKINGLVPATGVPKDLLNPTTGEDASLWIGAKLPTVATTTANGTDSTAVTITQTEQQAVLNWQSFNIGKNTTLNFDQSAGGTNAGQWIAFNKIGVTGSPSQILGSINTIGLSDAKGVPQVGGQVYVINPNGIIFGGSSQVNTHALIASSLPINDNLIKRGLLNNPDAQFLFSALSQDAGTKGTPVSTPTVIDEFLAPSDASDVHMLALKSATTSSATVSFVSNGAPAVSLVAGDDYVLSSTGTEGKMGLVFTAAGLEKKPSGTSLVQVAYTPTGDQYGNVEVQAGARLKTPTNTDHIGGRIALIGTNVINAGSISTPDGQTILAAGLQVAFAPHNSADPTLRGLDTFVGAVVDPVLNVTDDDGAVANTGIPVGTVTNDLVFNSDKTVAAQGLIEAARGAVTLTGKTVIQNGFIDSSTSVSYNGRVDLIAGYNAATNPKYDPSQTVAADFTGLLPFLYQSTTGAGDPVSNSGNVILGKDSVLRILPEVTSTDRVVGDLALPSQVNIQGQSVYFGTNATLLAPGAAVPSAKAFGFDGTALEAGVSVRAGAWFNPGSAAYRFVYSDNGEQIYLDQGATIDVAGSMAVPAAVSENIVSVELRGAELANSPLQRDGMLRGQTIQVDVRQHGPWDPTLNGGLGGYTWVGTPLANTAGWVGLATHSVGELTINGGSVSLRAGGPVVLQKQSTIDVSGGSIQYQDGLIQTTKVVAGGHVYDISQATPDRLYTGILSGTTSSTDPKWGVTQTTTNPLTLSTQENGYSQGGNGGSVSISAAVMALDGVFSGNTVAGSQQQTLSPLYNPSIPPDPANPSTGGVPKWLMAELNRPVSSQLAVNIGRESFRNANYFAISPMPANIVFTADSTLPAADAFNAVADYKFPVDRKYELDLAPSLITSAGFGILRIDNSDDNLGASKGYGDITISAGTELTMPVGGSLTLSAGNITVESGAKITIPGGAVTLNAYDFSTSLAEKYTTLKNSGSVEPDDLPMYDPTRGRVTLAGGATLSTAGEVADNGLLPATSSSLTPLTNAGSITINANAISIAIGSKMDVSGGVAISPAGKFSYGNAGSITLNAGKTFTLNAGKIVSNGYGSVVGGGLALSSDALQGVAGLGKLGGSLNLQAPSVVITSLSKLGLSFTDEITGALTLDPGFFNTGGFSSFSITGLGVAVDATGVMTDANPAFTVAPNTSVTPQVRNWQTLSGGPLYLAPEGVRQPSSLTFKAGGLLRNANNESLGNSTALVVGAGAVLSTDAGGSMGLTGATLDVLGTVSAKGGTISLTQAGDDTTYFYKPNIHLGAAGVLDASGATVFKSDLTGYHGSDVLDGGTISVSGNLVAEKGARFDVSGASATILVPPGKLEDGLSLSGDPQLVSVVKDSNGGTITLQADQVLLTAATLKATAGGTTAHGGSLNIISKVSNGTYLDGTTQFKADDVALTLTSFPTDFLYKGLGTSVTDKNGNILGDINGLGLERFGVASVVGGGFSNLNFSVFNRGALQVQGDVSLSAGRQITVADGGVLTFAPAEPTSTGKSALTLNASYVKLGRAFLGPQPSSEQSNPLGQDLTATHGDGALSVNATSLIDVGTLSLQNTATAVLNASSSLTSTAGAIRGDGTLDLAGAITLKAGQIYPPTLGTFNVIASDFTEVGALIATPGSVSIQGVDGTSPLALPLSAGGNLNIYASTITQAGTLRAPLGTITLGAGDISGTNPLSGATLPVTSSLVLLPGSVTSVSAIDPLTGKPITIPYGIAVNGDTWIDPTGTDITRIGAGTKSISLTADKIDFQAEAKGKPAASIDIAGGGDLSAYQFIPGTGGTTDVLLGSTANSFAIVPGFVDTYSPLASYNTSTDAGINLGSDPGLVVGNAKLSYNVGDSIHLVGGSGSPTGTFTLLPARYALLLPGAYLITLQANPITALAAPSLAKSDGAVLVSGYRYNALDAAGQTQNFYRTFEVASQAVVLKRAEYQQYTATDFFSGVAQANATVPPALPRDAGRFSLDVGTDLQLKGNVAAQAATGGRGGQMDISSNSDIVIGSAPVLAALKTAGAQNTLMLESKQLSNFGAESLLIGGTRTSDDKGTTVTVKTDHLTVDNAGDPLFGSDVILAANQSLTLKDGAEIGKANQPSIVSDPVRVIGVEKLNGVGDSIAFTHGGVPLTLPNGTPGSGLLTSTSEGTVTAADGTTAKFLASDATTGFADAFTVPAGGTITLDQAGQLTFADSSDTVVKPISLSSGDGALVRVGSDPNTAITRTGVAGSLMPALSLGAGAKIIGAGAILDSTNVTNLNEKIDLSAVSALSLNSGRISVLLDQPGAVTTTDSLVLSRAAQDSLLKSASAISLLSYSTLDLYGTGTFGSSSLSSLALHAGTIRGYPNSSDIKAAVNLAAKSIMLDNAANAAATIADVSLPGGMLTLNTGTLHLGGNQLEIQNFAAVSMNATDGVLTGDTTKLGVKKGGLNVLGGDLTINSPLVTGAVATNQSIAVTGQTSSVQGTTIVSGGKLSLLSLGSGVDKVKPGLGATLSLTGTSVEIDNRVKLPSGTLTVEATTGDLTVADGTLDVGGTTQQFIDVKKYTDGGRINFLADAGKLTIAAGTKISVSADPGGGSAGTLNIAVPSGSVSVATDTLFGQAGSAGLGGSFSLDTTGIAGDDPATSHLERLGEVLKTGGFDRSVGVRVRKGNVVADGIIRAHDITLAADQGKITVTGTLDASGLSSVDSTKPGIDPTGGKIDLSASGSVVLAPGASLTAAGYEYNDAGKGGTISLSAGNYTNGQIDTSAIVDVQAGAHIELGVLHNFTPNDQLLNPGVVLPVSTRIDFSQGTLHVRESQIAFGDGTQFGLLGNSVHEASGILLEGFQVFDLTKTDGSTPATNGAITSIGSGGLITSDVQKAVKDNGTSFLSAVNPGLVTNPLFQIQPGAEVVNNTSVSTAATRNFVNFNNSATIGRSLVTFSLTPGSGVYTTTLIPGGLPLDATLRITAGRSYTLTTADGVTSDLITDSADISSASATNPVIAVNIRNTGNTTLPTTLNFTAGATPFALALDSTTAITASSFAGRYSSLAGDITLASTWDLSPYRFGAQNAPGNLTLRAKGNLVFGFDASLNDGFDPTNAVFPTSPLWTARLQTGRSYSYRLVAGADYGAADSKRVQTENSGGTISGSVLLGAGSLALPTAITGASRQSIIPRYFQTIRTGTGDIEISAQQDVQFLNPLATVYTAGMGTDSLRGFDVPVLNSVRGDLSQSQVPYFDAEYSRSGGDLTINAQRDIARYIQSGSALLPDSARELPSNWLYRRSNVGSDGKFTALIGSNTPTSEIQSTSWWIDYSNFFDDTGALGGGNVTLVAGRNVSNINAAAPTNARMPGFVTDGTGNAVLDSAGNRVTLRPDMTKLVEFGGGDVTVHAGASIDGGVYYVERGEAGLRAGEAVKTNSTRAAVDLASTINPDTWMPTTFFVGKGTVTVAASGDILLGQVANPFWLPMGAGNRIYEKSYFSTFSPFDTVDVSSLGGTVTLMGRPDSAGLSSIGSVGWLLPWYSTVMSTARTAVAATQPWLRLAGTSSTPDAAINPFSTAASVVPATLRATAFGGDINLIGQLTLSPSPVGSVGLLASGNIGGLGVNGTSGTDAEFGSAVISLSDANPMSVPRPEAPVSSVTYAPTITNTALAAIDAIFGESGKTNLSLEQKTTLHGQTSDVAGNLVPLHYNDSNPVLLYAAGGDLSGLTLYSAKSARVVAANDITDIALYVQNVRAADSTLIMAGRDIVAYDPTSALRVAALKSGGSLSGTAGAAGPGNSTPTAGDIQVAGPGTLRVVAGRNLVLGSGSTANNDGTAVGITSVGAARNPYLPQNSGASILAVAGAGKVYTPTAAALGTAPGLATTQLQFSSFVAAFLDPSTAPASAARYLPVLGGLMGLSITDTSAIWTAFGFKPGQPLTEQQAGLVLNVFNQVLRDSARDRNDPASTDFGTYKNGFKAIQALFPGSPLPTKEDIASTVPVVRPPGPWVGNLSMATRLIKTYEGGDIAVLVPGGDFTIGRATDPQKPDQGVLTERGGGISIFAADNVNVGTSRIFTLRGGNEIVWSTWGNIAAGSGSKTVFSAPPTRVLVDPQSGDVQNDLAGLATGSGIGVLATLSGVKPGDVDLIAPVGTIDAGDAGIRSSGNLNLAARVVLNASNIQVGGTTAGTPPPPPAPNLGSLTAASTASAGASSAATDVARQNSAGSSQMTELPSLISVEVLGYGGDDDDDDDNKRKAATNLSESSRPVTLPVRA